jgi:uncharacterized membrane-anchored protein
MHPLRASLHDELHARPSLYFDGPAHVYHFALLDDGQSLEAIVRRLDELADNPGRGVQRHGLLRIAGCAFKWERHSEFLSLTWVVPLATDGTRWAEVPQPLRGLLDAHRELIIDALVILVENQQDAAQAPAGYGFKDPAGSHIGGGDATVWGDFRLSAQGYNRLLLVNRGLNAYRLGRMVRRLVEIETYRMLACLGLPAAQELGNTLQELDRELIRLAERNAEADNDQAKALLDGLTALSARVMRCSAASRPRFSATAAYAQIVFERIAELRESHVGEHQRLGIFLERRFKPSVRYCAATEQRLDRLADGIANLGELLQAKAQVEVEEQNSKILESLNARSHTQLKIQKAVEGFSLIAISYYLIGLLKMTLEGLGALGSPLSSKVLFALLAPLFLLTLLLLARRLKQAARH